MASIDITKSATIDATAERVWQILGEDFLDVARWASSVDHATDNPLAITGPEAAPTNGRSCTIAGFGQTDERLVAFDPTHRTLAYTATADKLPRFVRGMRNDWVVEQTGPNRAHVTTRITAQATGLMGAIAAPMMRMKLRTTQRQVLDDLRIYAETGSPSPAKLKAERAAARRHAQPRPATAK